MNTRYRRPGMVLVAFSVCIVLTAAGTRSAGTMRQGVINPFSEKISTPPEVRRYQIDAGQSHFIVHAAVGGLLSGFGHNHNISIPGISGEAEFTDGSVAPASLQMKVRADSLSVTDKVSDSDRQTIEKTMRAEVLETGKYPEIAFKSTS
jgi:polyisoprenoid-binding protein YceI